MIRDQKRPYRNLLRFVSCLLIQAFIIAQSSFNFAAVPDKIQFNEKYGRVRESFNGKNDKMIIHIQDAHCVYEAQKNIIGLVRDLYKNHNAKLITVEGADAYFNADEISKFPIQSVKQDVADYFLSKGRISGVEYLLIQNDLPITLRGAENRDLYIENYNSFMKTMQSSDNKAMVLIRDIDSALETLKASILNEKLKEIDNQSAMQNNGQLSFADFAKVLIAKAKENNVSIENYKNIQTLVKAQELENKISFDKVNTELTNLIEALSESLDKEKLSQVLNKNLFYKIGKLQPYAFFDYLKTVCKENSIDCTPYKNLSVYSDYLVVYESIDDIAIADEIASLKNEIKEKLYDNPEQKELLDLCKNINVMKKLLSLKVSKKEFKNYNENKKDFTEKRFIDFLSKTVARYDVPFNFDRDFSIISAQLPVIDEFYKIALKRNEALIENTLSEMELEDSNIAILITGGFHTQGISELLKEQGISYKVISPSITEQPTSNAYLTRMAGVVTEIEEILSSNRLQVPLVLADPSIISDTAKSQTFINTFKMLLESHPQAAGLQKTLDESPTGYKPSLTFIDAFSLGDNKYASFNLGGQKFNVAFVKGDVKDIPGSINGKVDTIGNYTIAFINDAVFANLVVQSRTQGGIIDARTGVDSKIETALIQGTTAVFQQPEQSAIDNLIAGNYVVKQADGTYKPTLGYLMNSKVSALIVQPRVAQVGGFDVNTQSILASKGIQKVEVYSNHVDFNAQDAKELENKLADLIANNRITLASGKNVYATVENGVAQIYSMTPQGDLKLKPQLIISDQVLETMVPEAPAVKVASASQSVKMGGIEVNVAQNKMYLYELNEKGEVVQVGKEIYLKPGLTSMDFYRGVSELRNRAVQENIGFLGYSGKGLPVSFDNYNVLLESLENNPLSSAFKNVNKFLSVAPSLQGLDLKGIENTQQLIDYFRKFTEPTEAGKITCAAAATAWAHDKMPVRFNDKAFNLEAGNALDYLPQLMEFIENRMKGARTDVSFNLLGQPEYSLYTVGQASRVFGVNTSAVSIDKSNLEPLLNTLLPGEAAVLRVELNGLGHYVTVKRDIDGFSLYDIDSDNEFSKLDQIVPKKGTAEITAQYLNNFTGEALVRPNTGAMSIATRLSNAKVDFKEMDINQQLASLGACGVGSTNSLALTAQIGAILEGRGFDNYGRGIKIAYSMEDLAKLGITKSDVIRVLEGAGQVMSDTDWAINTTSDAGKDFIVVQASSRGVGPATRSETVIDRDLNEKFANMLKILVQNTDPARNANVNIDVVNDTYKISFVDDKNNPVEINPSLVEVLQHTRYKTKGGDRPANAHHETYKLYVDGLVEPISLSLGFNGDFESYVMYKNILKNKYNEQFLATSDTEVITHLLARLSITKKADGTLDVVPGQEAITRFFRLADTIEAMLNVADILRNKTYSPGYITALKSKLRAIGIDPDQLLDYHAENLKFDSVKYPKIAVDLIYDVIDNPWILDDSYIAQNKFFGNTKFVSISELLRNEFAIKKATDLALADYISIEDSIDGLLKWMIGDGIPKELSGKTDAEKQDALDNIINYIKGNYAPFVIDTIYGWIDSLKNAKDTTLPSEWNTKRDNMFKEFKLFAASAEKAANYVTSTGKVSVMAFNYATGHDMNRLIGARFGPKSTDMYLGIGNDAQGKPGIGLSSEPRAFGPLYGVVKEKAEVIENVLALARGEIILVTGGNYEVYYVNENDIRGKSADEIAHNVHRINAITGVDTIAKAKVSDTSWNLILDPEKAAKMSAFETEAAVQGTTIRWTLEGLTKKNPQTGLLELNLGLNEDQIKPILDIMNVVGGGSGTSLNALSLAMEEARRNGYQLMDLALDADIIKASQPLITKQGITVSLIVSQSGTTGVAVQNAKDALNSGAKVLVLTNRRGSTCDNLAKNSLNSIITKSIDERAVAATGSNTNQIVALRLLGLYLAQLRDPKAYDAQRINNELAELFKVSDLMKDTVKMCREKTGDFKDSVNKLISYMRKYGYDLGNVYSSMNGTNIRIGGIGLTKIADEFETKETEMVRYIIGSRPVDIVLENGIEEQPQMDKPDFTGKINTVEAMLNTYLGAEEINVDQKKIKLTDDDLKNLKNITILGQGKHNFTIEHIEDNYMPRHIIPVSKRMYNNDIAGIDKNSLVIALSPETDYEKSVIDKIIATGAKVVVIGPAEIKGAGFFQTFGTDSVFAEFLGAEMLMQYVSAFLGARDFQTSGQIKAAVDSLKSQLDGMKKMSTEFYQPGTNNRINMKRYIDEIRKPGRGWRRLAQMNVGKVNQLSSAAYYSNRFEAATGNIQIYKELATMKHGYYAPLNPGAMVTLFIPKKGTPGYDNCVKGIEEMLPRINFPYAPFLEDTDFPIGVLVAITAENPDDPMIKLLTDEEYAILEKNTRDGKEDLIKRPHIVFQTPHGGVLEDFLLADLITYELNQAYNQDRQTQRFDANIDRGNVYINVEYPETPQNQARLAVERDKLRDFKDNFPNSFILTIAPQSVQGVEDYSDAVIRIPAADSTLALAVNHFLSLELTKARFMPLLQVLNQFSNDLKNNPRLGQMTPYDLLAGYAKGTVSDMQMQQILSGQEWADANSWKYYRNIMTYLFTEGNIDGILSMAAAGVSVDDALIFTVDLIKGLAKVVTNDNRYTAEELQQISKSMAALGLTKDQAEKFVGQGSFTLVAPVMGQRFISARPEGILRIAAAVRGISQEQLVNEGLYHEMIHSAIDIMPKIQDGADISKTIFDLLKANQLPAEFTDAFNAFVNIYYPDTDMISDQALMEYITEAVAKVYTHKLSPSTSPEFFKTPQAKILIDTIDGLTAKIPALHSIVNPVVPTVYTPQEIKSVSEENITRITQNLQDIIGQSSVKNKDQILATIPKIDKIDTDPEQDAYLRQIVSAELMAAIKALNTRADIGVASAVETATEISGRIKADIETAKQRMDQDLSKLPNLTAMNVSFFQTEDGLSDSKTIGISQKIKEFVSDPKNVFIVYSLTQESQIIKQILATKGISDKEVMVVGTDTLKTYLGNKFVADQPEQNILQLPSYVEQILNIKGIKLMLSDFTIIEGDKKVADIAMDNLASVLDVPQGFMPENLQNGQEIELGISAFELANMLEAGEDLPGDLIITQVSTQNKFIADAINAIKAQRGVDAEISLDDLRSYLGLEKLNKEDLRGIKLKRKLKITDSFIKNLKAQRALDISA